MGRDLHFRLGSFYRVDDRTGFPTRAERTAKEWQGLIVDKRVYEPRQPQDLVKGVPDFQNVPEPRPLAPNQFVGPLYVQTTAAVGPGATIVQVQSFAGFNTGVTISVMMNDGVNFNTTVAGVSGDGVELAEPMPGFAASGNLVTIDRNTGPPDG